MNRNQQILAVVLAIQIILGIIVFWPKPGGMDDGESFFPGMQATDIVAVTITDNQGKAIRMRQLAGDWVLPEAGDYPAEADKITPVLDKIVGLNTQRLVTRTDASHERLQVAVDDFMRRVDLETADGARHALYVGSSPQYGAHHVRVGGRDETYLTDDLTAWELNVTATSWVDSTYLNIEKDRLTHVIVENVNGTFGFTREDGGDWVLDGLAEGEQLSAERVSSVVNKASSVMLTTPLGQQELAEYGLDNPQAIVTLVTADQTFSLLIGAQDPDDKSYVVHASTSPYYVSVSEYNAQPLVENTRSDFLEPEATPTP